MLLDPISLIIFCFLGRDIGIGRTPPLPSLVPEFRKIGKRYVKAVLAVLGTNW